MSVLLLLFLLLVTMVYLLTSGDGMIARERHAATSPPGSAGPGVIVLALLRPFAMRRST